MTYLKYGVGIDMALEKFDVCLALIDHAQKVSVIGRASFSNNDAGFVALLGWTQKHCKEPVPVTYLTEATGIYHEQLAWYLFEKDQHVSVILPNKAKKYKEALGLKSKTDAIDAFGLARLACEQHLKPWQPLSKNIYKLRLLTRQVEAVAEQLTVAKNQLHALSHGRIRMKEVEKLLTGQLALLEGQKQKLEKMIEALVNSDTLLKKKFADVLALKGLGFQSLATVVAETDGFALTENERQLTSYAGYDVVENQSGKRTGSTKISKKGNQHIRRALHFPALNVVRYEQGGFKQLYERVHDRTGIKMKGYVAVQRKLLCLIYTLWKKDVAFDNTKSKAITSGEAEAGLSFASASQKPSTKRASTKAEAPQDKLPSKPRRKLSFA